MNMSAYLSGFTYLLSLSPDKRRQTTNQIDTQAHLFKLPPHQQDVSWSTPAMLTKRKSVTAPSMAHTGKLPPEPPPKGRLFFKSSKPRWSNMSMLEAPLPLQNPAVLSSRIHVVTQLKTWSSVQFIHHGAQENQADNRGRSCNQLSQQQKIQ